MNKVVFGVIGMVVSLAAIIGVAFKLNSPATVIRDQKELEHVQAVAPGETQQSSSQPIQLNGTAPQTTSALGLGVTGQSSTGGAASGNSNSSAAQSFDPSSFAQYDKYKDGTSALFGDVQVGSGAELTAKHKAAVFYKGWLTNGQSFDQSRAGSDGKLEPFVFTLGEGRVISGWEQGIAGMKVGGTRLLIVPPSVGYGAQGQGSIPPNAVLIFQVQLAAVE